MALTCNPLYSVTRYKGEEALQPVGLHESSGSSEFMKTQSWIQPLFFRHASLSLSHACFSPLCLILHLSPTPAQLLSILHPHLSSPNHSSLICEFVVSLINKAQSERPADLQREGRGCARGSKSTATKQGQCAKRQEYRETCERRRHRS